MVTYIKFFKNHNGMNLLFSSSIIELCKRVGVVEYHEDTWVLPCTPIYPLKIWCEGASINSKKRKIDLGKSTYEKTKSCRTSTTSLFEEDSIDLRAIRDLVLGLPQVSG